MTPEKDVNAYYDSIELTREEQDCVQELHNIAARIVEDCEVDDEEIKFISTWLEKHVEHRRKWPISTIFTLLTKIMEDGKVDEEERLQLLSVFTGLAIFADDK